MRRYFLFDCESGGLDAKSVSLLSLYGMILSDKLEVVDKIDLIIKPDDGRYHVDIEALKVNKVDLIAHSMRGITESTAGAALKNFLLKYSNLGSMKLIPAGHNIGRLDIPMGERLVGIEEWNKRFVQRTLDTGTIGQYLILRGIIPETNNGSLAQLCIHYGIDVSGAHEAKVDVEMTHKLLLAMVKDGLTV